MSGFSDPKWWPQPPPAAPKHISRGAVLMRGVLPLIVIAAVVAFVVVSERNHNAAAARSQAAYTHCLLTHDAAIASAATSAISAQAIADCQALDPAAATPQRGPGGAQQATPGSPQSLFNTCIRNALGSSGGSHSRFSRGGASPAFQAAVLVCESIAGSSQGRGAPIGPSSTTGTTPPKL